MSVLALSTSASKSSLNYRGLQLLDYYCKFDTIDCVSNYDIPVVNANGMDEEVPDEMKRLSQGMYQHDKFVFAIPEFTGMMSSSTKNILDWMVVMTNMNLGHGEGYPWTNKHVILLTFTPSGAEGGNRHMPHTKDIFKKLGANVIHTEVFNYGWKTVVPNNHEEFKESAYLINNYLLYEESNTNYFNNEYKKWNEKWI
jgi:NAD(P)H-dependent FMN reductase